MIKTVSSPDNIRYLSEKDQYLSYDEQQKKIEYKKNIERLRELIPMSKNPEMQHQAMAILYFQRNRTIKALQAVKLAETSAVNNGTYPSKIYLSLFLRAKYLSLSETKEDLLNAMGDLEKIFNLKNISQEKFWEITNLYDHVKEKLQLDEKKIREKFAEMKIPQMQFSDRCKTTKSVYNATLGFDIDQTFGKTDAEDLKKHFDGDKEALVTHVILNADLKDGASLHYKACLLAKEGIKELYEGKPHGEESCWNAKKLFDKVIDLGDKALLVNPEFWFNCAVINVQFIDYLQKAYEYIESAILIAPEIEKYHEFKECIKNVLIEKEGREKLVWIDKTLSAKENNPDLWLWKAEIHSMLNEKELQIQAAENLLKLIDDKHIHYEKALKLINS